MLFGRRSHPGRLDGISAERMDETEPRGRKEVDERRGSTVNGMKHERKVNSLLRNYFLFQKRPVSCHLLPPLHSSLHSQNSFILSLLSQM